MNKENVITLDNPVKRGEQVIEQVTLMKPNAGTLRGVSLAAVANSEVDALIKVLPRMTAPMLTEQEVAALELPDLVAYFHERRSLNNFHRDRVITFEQIAE